MTDASIQSLSMAHDTPRFNLPLPTLGGLQFWTDVRWRSGFRIQRNAITKHHRLLSPGNVRLAWGTKSQCLDALDKHCPPQRTGGRCYVVLLHGLLRSSRSMRTLEKAIRDADDTEVISFDYASSRAPMSEHAKALGEVLENLPADATLRFACHSMGNIVLRHWIADTQRKGDPCRLLQRCRSLVMLGPPNHGAEIARGLAPTKIFGWIAGKSAMQLGVDWKDIAPGLATPPFPFHVLMGDVRSFRWHPLITGPNDGIVAVEEARLEGAESFELFPVAHGVLIYSKRMVRRTVELLTQS
ncbi:MAG: alpha/beta hydrolase [Planctomycetota bacterium]